MYCSIAEKHNETKYSKNINNFFFPQSAILYSLLYYSNIADCSIEWDINECLSYEEKPGNWLSYTLDMEEKKQKFSSYLNYDFLFIKVHNSLIKD